MRFILLVKSTKDFEAGRFPDETIGSEIAQWSEDLTRAGARLGSNRLHPSSKGTRVRYARGRFQVTDGPFAESKELIAGYCMIRASSLDEAVAWAKRVPFEEGEIEVRPLLELSDIPVNPAEQPDCSRDNEDQIRAAQPTRKPGTVRYMGLLKGDPDTEAGKIPEEKVLTAVGTFMEEGAKAGVFLTAEGLQPSSKGARVRYSGRNRVVTDGPFAETKELVAGFMLLQFPTKDAAIEWTKRFVEIDAPGRYRGESECEIRPVFEKEDEPERTLEHFRHTGIGPQN